MNEIILSTQNGEPVASSRQIAENFEKRHDHVMRDIPRIKQQCRNVIGYGVEVKIIDL